MCSKKLKNSRLSQFNIITRSQEVRKQKLFVRKPKQMFKATIISNS